MYVALSDYGDPILRVLALQDAQQRPDMRPGGADRNDCLLRRIVRFP